MEEEYYPLKGKMQCFGCSLANLLVVLGERVMAKQVYEKFSEHPLFYPEDGIYYATATKIVSDLTEGSYNGKMYGTLPENLEKSLIENGWENAKDILTIIEEELQKGNIRLVDKIESNQLPSIILAGGHAIVESGEKRYIDDGLIKEYPLLKDIHAVIEVNKT